MQSREPESPPHSAGHIAAAAAAAHNALGLPGCKCAVLGHMELLITNTPKSSPQGALSPFSTQPALGIAPIQVEDLALGLGEI